MVKDIQELGVKVGTWIPTLELTIQLFAEPAPGIIKEREEGEEREGRIEGRVSKDIKWRN